MKNLLILLLAFTAQFAIAQNNFEPGYFISNDGTTTTCLIKNLGWKNNPTAFEYKTAEASVAQTATIANVQEFGVSGYKFVKHTINIDRSTTDISQMEENNKPVFKSETLFLKVLVEGKAVLYQYEDGNLIRYFYSGGDNNSAAQQLIYKAYKVGQDLAYNNQFRGQLFEALKSAYPDIVSYKRISYDKDTLVKLFLAYNNQSGTETKDLSASQNQSVFNIKITAGASSSSLSVYGAGNTDRAYDFDAGLSYRFGAEFEVVLPFNNKKWSLFADPNFYMYNKESTEIIGSTSTPKNWKAKSSGVDLPLGARHYMFLNDKSKIFIDAAYVLTFPTGSSNISFVYDAPNAVPSSQLEISRSANFSAGAGFAYNRYSVAVRYNFKRQLLSNYALYGAD